MNFRTVLRSKSDGLAAVSNLVMPWQQLSGFWHLSGVRTATRRVDVTAMPCDQWTHASFCAVVLCAHVCVCVCLRALHTSVSQSHYDHVQRVHTIYLMYSSRLGMS